MSPALLLLTQVAIIAYAVLGGVFLAFSDFIMRALRRVEGGAEAMQSVNREVFRIVFMALFLLSVPLSLVLAGIGLVQASHPAPFVLAGGLYLAGAFGVTAAGNVPLNTALAARNAADAETQRWWKEVYQPRWTRLNSVRTVACLAAAVVLLRALGQATG